MGVVSPEAAYQAFWWKWTAIATLILFAWSALFALVLYVVVTKPIVAALLAGKGQ